MLVALWISSFRHMSSFWSLVILYLSGRMEVSQGWEGYVSYLLCISIEHGAPHTSSYQQILPSKWSSLFLFWFFWSSPNLIKQINVSKILYFSSVSESFRPSRYLWQWSTPKLVLKLWPQASLQFDLGMPLTRHTITSHTLDTSWNTCLATSHYLKKITLTWSSRFSGSHL